MEPLRILHVTPYYEHAWAYGGIPRVAANLCRALARRGHHVSVCTTDARDAHSRLAPAVLDGVVGGVVGGAVGGAGDRAVGGLVNGAGNGIEHQTSPVDVRVFPNRSNRLAYHWQFFTPRGLRQHMKHHAARFHVAHIHGHHHLPGVLAAAALQEAGVPYLVAPNGTAPRIERRRAAKWLFDRTLGHAVLPGAERLVAVTRAERRQLLHLGIPDNSISILPNSLEIDEFDGPIERSDLRALFSRRPKRVVLYLGKLTPRKGLDVLLRALPLLRTESAGLVIAGNDMGMDSTLRGLVSSLGLADRVRFMGLQRGRDRLEVLAGADVVAYPGIDEIFGLVPLEAILCGTPVVVADDSGCGEVVGEVGGGRVVAARNPTALALALDGLMAGEPGTAVDMAAARAQVVERFGSDGVAARFEDLYRELASRKSEV